MPEPTQLSETDSFLAWQDEEEGELSFHVDLGSVTLHFDAEEWRELLELFRPLV